MEVKEWGGKMKNGSRLFRRPKLALSCSAEGKEETNEQLSLGIWDLVW
jgi:hypothetical protein